MGLVGWNGMGWHIIKFYCLDWWDVNGMKWNRMESIPFYTIQSFFFLLNKYTIQSLYFSFHQFGGIQWNETYVLKFYYSTIILFASSSTQSQFSTHSFLHFFILTAHLTFFFYGVFSFLHDFSSQSTSFLSNLLWNEYLWAIYFVIVCLYACLVMCIEFHLSPWSFHFYYVYHNISPLWVIYFMN